MKKLLIVCGTLICTTIICLSLHSNAQPRRFPGPIAIKARIVTLSPALTEMIYALSFDDLLVGVSEFSDYPLDAKTKPSVGPYTKPDMEKLIALHADLVLIGQEGPEDVRTRLDQLKIPYTVISMRRLSEIGDAAVLISDKLGDKIRGEKFSNTWREDVAKAFGEGRLKSEGTIETVIEIQNEPLMVAAHDTFLDEIVTGCGGHNIFETQNSYPRISRETIVTKKPKLILLADFFAQKSERETAIKSWHKYPNTKLIPVVALDVDTTTRPGPRLVKGIEGICKILKGIHKNE